VSDLLDVRGAMQRVLDMRDMLDVHGVIRSLLDVWGARMFVVLIVRHVPNVHDIVRTKHVFVVRWRIVRRVWVVLRLLGLLRGPGARRHSSFVSAATIVWLWR
jgi:hypothetical protein